MIELVLSICLSADPGRCKDEYLTMMSEGGTPYQCMINGQLEIAYWVKRGITLTPEKVSA